VRPSTSSGSGTPPRPSISSGPRRKTSERPSRGERQLSGGAYSADRTSITFHFEVDLTPSQAARFADIVAIAHSKVELDPTDFTAIKADIQTLIAFQAIATPTLAQTVAATKAQTRVLRAMLRN